MTLTEKLLARAAGKARVQAGDNVWVQAGVLMKHDVCGPGTIGVFKREFGAKARVWDRHKVVIIPDHYIFTADSKSNRNVDILREFVREQQLPYFYDVIDDPNGHWVFDPSQGLLKRQFMSVITCPSCNTPAPPGAIFCDHCGYDLRTIAPMAPPLTPRSSAPAPQAQDGDIICSNCQHVNIAGSAFCENCGAQLTQASRALQTPQQSTWQQPVVVPASKATSVQSPVSPHPLQDSAFQGRLVIQETQVALPIPAGKQEIILGREDPVSGIFPDIDLDPYGGHEAGVGRRHARLIIKSGQVYLEDLDSVNGTAVNRQRIPAHQSVPLKTGDEVRLGKMALMYFAG